MNRVAKTAILPRDVAQQLTTVQGADDSSRGIDPIPKRLLGALLEQAFPDAAPRGPAYEEEQKDIGDWLLSNATAHEEDSEYRLLATAGAWIAQERGAECLPLVRAIAVHFLRIRAATLAWTANDDASERPTEKEGTRERYERRGKKQG